MFQSVSGYISRPTVSQLRGVSGTISNWSENHRPKRTQIFTVTNDPFRSKLNSDGLQVDRNRKFSERIFSAPAIFKATSKFYGSLSCSDDKNWLDLSSIFFKICRFAVQFCFRCKFSFHKIKFASGVIFFSNAFCIDHRWRQMAVFAFSKWERPHFRAPYVK